MRSECAAVGSREKLTKEFSFHAFPFKNEARKRQWQVAMNWWDLATKKLWEPKHFEKNASQIAHCLLSIQFGLKYMSVHRLTDLDKFPVWISKEEVPTPLPVVGPLFISILLFNLSRALLGAWCFGLFHCVYSSFHNRLDLIREPSFCLVFHFPNLSVFVSSYVKMKKFC